MAGDWTVTEGAAAIPEGILAAAAAAQATLSEKLAALRSLNEPFPSSVGPAATDRWISDAGPASAATASGGGEDPVTSPGSVPPTAGNDLADLGAAALLEGYRTGAFDPVDVVDACLARIDGTGGAIAAVVARPWTAPPGGRRNTRPSGGTTATLDRSKACPSA